MKRDKTCNSSDGVDPYLEHHKLVDLVEHDWKNCCIASGVAAWPGCEP